MARDSENHGFETAKVKNVNFGLIDLEDHTKQGVIPLKYKNDPF